MTSKLYARATAHPIQVLQELSSLIPELRACKDEILTHSQIAAILAVALIQTREAFAKYIVTLTIDQISSVLKRAEEE